MSYSKNILVSNYLLFALSIQFSSLLSCENYSKWLTLRAIMKNTAGIKMKEITLFFMSQVHKNTLSSGKFRAAALLAYWLYMETITTDYPASFYALFLEILSLVLFWVVVVPVIPHCSLKNNEKLCKYNYN